MSATFVPTAKQQEILDYLGTSGPTSVKKMQRKFPDMADFLALQRGKRINFSTGADGTPVAEIYQPRERKSLVPATPEEKEAVITAIKALRADGRSAKMKTICERMGRDHRDIPTRNRFNVILRSLQEDGLVVKAHDGSNFRDNYLPL